MANRARKVIQCDTSGQEIRCFQSASEASFAMGSRYATSIHRSIQYGSLAFGYRWKYEGEELKSIQSGTPGVRRKVISIDMSTMEETLYQSLSEASRLLGIKLSAIEAALQTGCIADGYRFRYEGMDIVTQAKKHCFRRSIVGIGEAGEVKHWSSAYDASKELDVSSGAIYGCLNNKNPNAKCKGYRLRYEEDESKE